MTNTEEHETQYTAVNYIFRAEGRLSNSFEADVDAHRPGPYRGSDPGVSWFAGRLGEEFFVEGGILDPRKVQTVRP